MDVVWAIGIIVIGATYLVVRGIIDGAVLQYAFQLRLPPIGIRNLLKVMNPMDLISLRPASTGPWNSNDGLHSDYIREPGVVPFTHARPA